MKLSSLLRLSFAGVLLTGLSMTASTLRAEDNGGGCPFSCGAAKQKCASPTPSPTPARSSTSTNAPTKS